MSDTSYFAKTDSFATARRRTSPVPWPWRAAADPSLPERLRIAPSPYHDDDLIDGLAEALLQVWDGLGLSLCTKSLAAE